MGTGDNGFLVAANFLIIAPLLLLLRAAFPTALTVRLSFIGVGCYLLYLVSPRFVLFFIFYWLVIWLLQLRLGVLDTIQNKKLSIFATTSAICMALSPMVLWKLFPESFTLLLNEGFAKIFWFLFPGAGFADALAAIAAPIGLSFTVFRATDLLIKIRLGILDRLSLDRLMYYGLFPPVLAVGPIIEYEEVRVEGPQPKIPLPGDIAVGMFRVALGCTKIFLIAILFERLSALNWMGGEAPFWQMWIALFLFALYFYVNFSGYSDLAIGATRIFGIKLKENFNNPFLQTNPSAFWNNWHMSLTRWVNRNVFIPLGGMRKNRQYFAIFMTIIVIALWHDFALPLIIFGFYHGIILVTYRWLDDRRRRNGVEISSSKWAKGAKMFCVFAFVALSIPLLRLNSEQIIPFYASLLPGFGG